jgi:murein DD-endopeptidase MepM/ murein hydrolase activator NlpD
MTLRFVLGRRLVTVAVPPYLLILLALVAAAGYLLGGQKAVAERRRQTEMLAVLRDRNQQLERSLTQKERERDELAALAETRSEQLWGELQDRERELRRLWSALGQKPRGHSEARPSLSARGSGSSPALALRARFQQLQARLREGDAEQHELAAAAGRYRRLQKVRLARATPSMPPCVGDMSSGFGYRFHPIYGIKRLHSGCDFSTDYGTRIHATADGTVKSADWLGGYGQCVQIDHGHGLSTLYAHCGELKVRKGQLVRRGQLIATVGTTGLSSGPHCHYEVRKDGKPVDPMAFLPPLPSARI